MASEVKSGQIPITSPVHGSQAPLSVSVTHPGGKTLPPNGNGGAALPPTTSHSTSGHANPPIPRAPPSRGEQAPALAAVLNNFLNNSGRPDQFRVAPNSDNKLLQQINPATGAVVGVFPVSEFPALARSIGASGLLIDRLA